MPISTSLTRRTFGLGLGAALLAAPFVSLLGGGERARGATGGVAKRLVLFFSPNGTVHARRRPTGTGTSFSFPAGSILEPLAPLKQHLTVIDGLDFFGADNHEGGMAAMLTGGRGSGENAGKSVDQYIAGKIGGATRFASLELGVQTSAWGGNAQTRMSYTGPGQFAPPDDDPASVYRRFWGDLGGAPGELDANLRQRRSVIDLAQNDLGRLRARLGAEEQAKLEQHLDALRRLEQGLGGGAGTCAAPGAPPAGSPAANDRFPAITRAQLDLLLAALGCGLTNVASIQLSHTVGPPVFSWLGLGEGHHSLSHMGDENAAGVAQFVAAERWIAEQFAYLVGELAATPDPAGGSLLDGTLVVWCKEMGDSRLHVCKDVPFVLAGKAGGYLAPGRYLHANGASHQRLLVSICQAMGLTNQTFGDGSGGTGPLPGLA